ncbi:MAG: hypothetical protein Q4C58_11605, partial [Eubacteriales bacterium]|nr:hypothetical protein [Eubacteriales bacterium]
MGKWRRLHKTIAILLAAAFIGTGSGFTVLAAGPSDGIVNVGMNNAALGDETGGAGEENGEIGNPADENEDTKDTTGGSGKENGITGEDENTKDATDEGGNEDDTAGEDGDIKDTTGENGEDEEIIGEDENAGDSTDEAEEQQFVAVAEVIFQDKEGNVLEGTQATIEREIAEGETYTFTEDDIIEVVPDGYTLVEADLTEAVAEAGSTIEIIATVEKTVTRRAAPRAAQLPGVVPVPNVVMNTSYIQEVPAGAKWFFDAAGETASFGTTDIDVYRDDLPGNRANPSVDNTLTLYSSTDGGIYNLENYVYQEYGSPKNPGVLSIDWESGYYTDWPITEPVDPGIDYSGDNVNNIPSTGKLFGEGYTDGSYTIVGWGGSFEGSLEKNELTLRVRDCGDNTLDDAMSHLTIYLVGPSGAIYDKIWVQEADGHDNGNTNCLYWDGTDNDGNYVFKAKLHGSAYAQGIKFAFDRTSEYEGGSTQLRHSGSMLIAQVEILCSDGNNHDFSPFKYTSNMKNGTYLQDEYDSNYLPFIRSRANNSGTGEEAQSGANISEDYDWHLWTMSTSDANIVNNYTSNTDALQIKYRDDQFSATSKDSAFKPHETDAELRGTKDLNAHWLVLTLGTATYDDTVLNTKVQLVDINNVLTDVRLSDFVKSTEPESEKIDAHYIEAQYQTVYFDLTTLEGFNGFRSVKFLFDDVKNGKTEDEKSRNSRYLYLTQVYLLGEAATIHKTVDKTSVEPGEELTYTITLRNNGTTSLNSYTIKDALPENAEFVSCMEGSNDLGGCYDAATHSLTINGSNLDIGATVIYSVKMKVAGSAKNGDLLQNQAEITSLNGTEVDVKSELVKTVVTSNAYVFYAEVGQTTTLPVNPTITTLPGGAEKKTYNAAGNEADAFASTTWGSVVENPTIFTADNGELFQFAEGWNLITFKALGPEATDARDIGLNSVSLYVNDSQIATVGGSTVKTDANDSYLAPVGAPESGSGYFYVPKGKAQVEYANDVIGNVGDNYVYILVYLTAENLANGNTGKIGFRYCTADRTETATFSCEPVNPVTGEPETQEANLGSVDQDTTLGHVSKATEKVLSYSSKQSGTDIFTVPLDVEGKTASITVHNYQVQDRIYVLDYGLKADLTADDADNTNGLLKGAVLSNEGDGASAAFVGLARNRRNNNGTADVSDDYLLPYGDAGTEQKLDMTNGAASYTGAIDNNLQVIYEPTKFMDSVDTFYYGVKVTQNDRTDDEALNAALATPVMEGEVKVMPASVVYYEDNFVAITGNGTETAG